MFYEKYRGAKEFLKSQIKKFFELKGDSEQVLKKQKQLKMIVLITCAFFVSFTFWLYDSQKSKTQKKESTSLSITKQKDDIKFISGGELAKKDDLWRTFFDNKVKNLKSELSDTNQNITKSLEEVRKTGQSEISELKGLVSSLTNQIEELKVAKETPADSFFAEDGQDEVNFDDEGQGMAHGPKLQVVSVQLSERPVEEPLKTVDNTIPAGSFVKAILLNGVVASTALNASANPIPVAIRFVDNGRLPRGFLSDLDGCNLIVGSSGDLSSERVNMQLQTLACIERETGEVIETEVAGYVVGSDGMQGVRGVVVEKVDELLRNAAAASLLSGVASVASPENRKENVPFGVFSQNGIPPQRSYGEVFQNGFMGGVNNAANKWTDYHIGKVEQIHPVIEVPAGQYVDVVFMESTFIGSSNVKQRIAEIRDASRLKEAKRAAKNSNRNVGR